MVIKIEEFVGQKYNLEAIYREFPTKRNELTVCDTLFQLLNNKQVLTITKVHKDLS